ncbi:Thiaminase-2 [Listeria monocytogenes N53-1]|nr:Thiaminase-2 [Listeria monocytogenes N53-1]
MHVFHGFQEEVGDLWQETLQHPFVQSLADGTLEKEAFYYYLDDYYLSHFEKVIEKSVQAGTAQLAAEMREVQVRLQQSELLMREQFYPRVGLTERDFSERKPAPTAYHYTSHLYRMADFGSFGVTIAFCRVMRFMRIWGKCTKGRGVRSHFIKSCWIVMWMKIIKKWCCSRNGWWNRRRVWRMRGSWPS